MVLSAVSLN